MAGQLAGRRSSDERWSGPAVTASDTAARSLLVRNVRVAGSPAADLLVEEGRIQSIGSGLLPAGRDIPVVDAGGGLVLPGLVDAHAHLDKTTWGLPYRPNSAGPSLQDLVDNERRYRRELGASVEARALAFLTECVHHGTSFMRTHVDIDTECGLSNLEGVAAAAHQLADSVSVQIVAFPQSGVIGRPGTAALLERAISSGADVIGGIDPAGFDRDPVRHLDVVFGIAERRGVPIDIHLHDPGELGAWEMELIAERTSSLGMSGQVTISHAFALATVDEPRQRQLIQLLASAEISIASAASASHPMIPVSQLVSEGVRVCIGNDGVRDLWSPYGNGDVLERAMVVASRCGFRHDEEIQLAVGAATYGGAAVLGIESYGLHSGSQADFVVVEGETYGDAVARHAPRRLVVKGGRVIHTGPSAAATAGG